MMRGTKGNLLSPPLCRAFVSFDRDSLQAPVMFKRWIALSTEKITIQWITQLVFVLLISLIAIYPVDSATQLLNNQWQEFKQKLSELVMSNRRNPLGKSKLMTSRPSTFSVHKFQIVNISFISKISSLL